MLNEAVLKKKKEGHLMGLEWRGSAMKEVFRHLLKQKYSKYRNYGERSKKVK